MSRRRALLGVAAVLAAVVIVSVVTLTVTLYDGAGSGGGGDGVDNRRRFDTYTNSIASVAARADAAAATVDAGIVLDEDDTKAHRAPRLTLSGTTDTIFVSVASFRDNECGPMLLDMYHRAEKPRRVFAGVVEQHAPGDPPCLQAGWIAEHRETDKDCQLQDFCPSDNVRVRRIDPKHSRGPTFGRYVAMLMWRGERYFLMLDSHNRFILHWDTVITTMHAELSARHPRPVVLSHYPEGYSNESNFNFDRESTSYLCKAKYLDWGVLRFDGIVIPTPKQPLQQPYAAAGFLFAEASMVHNVPFDPHLDYLFDGEEVLYSARMWTHGYDIFSPTRNVVFHFYGRHGAPKVWDTHKQWSETQAKTKERVQYLLEVTRQGTEHAVLGIHPKEGHILRHADKYGMGSVRTLDEWYRFAGINKIDRRFDKDWCATAQQH